MHLNRCHFVDCGPGWRHDCCFDDWDLWFVLDGSGRYHAEDGLQPIAAGDCFCFPPGRRQRIDLDERQRIFICAVHVDAAGDAFSPPLHRRLDELAFVHGLLRRLVRGWRAGSDDVPCWLAALVAELVRQDEGRGDGLPDEWRQGLDRLCAEIIERPQEDWSAGLLAGRFHCSVAHLSRRFRAHAGRPLSAFVIDARLDQARRLLRETAMPIKAVAANCGYRSVHFFTRQFGERIGQTPQAFRRQGD